MKKGKKECKVTGCGRVVQHDVYCEAHRGMVDEKRRKNRKAKQSDDVDKIYKTQRWRRVRALQLKENPLCDKCRKEGKVKDAEMVDHIKPIRAGGNAYNMDNLQSLCQAHHNKKTALDNSTQNIPREG
jgi:5-methylcytosine-specific restriction protein A